MNSTFFPALWCRVCILVLTLGVSPLWALILTGKGNDPVHDPGWPAGAVELANLNSRFGWFEGPPFGGGDWTFFFSGKTSDLQAAVTTLAGVKSDRREIVLHEGPAYCDMLKEQGATQGPAYDWSFEVWVPENWKRRPATRASARNWHRPESTSI
jgi:hypothetical protein